MDEIERYPWEQLDDEPLTAYRRFMVYRDMGPGRTIDKAYRKAGKGRETHAKSQASGTWLRDSSAFNWRDRATAFDIEMMSQYGTEAVINWVLAIVELSAQTLEEIQTGKLKPRSFEQLLGALDVLGKFVTPETVEAAREFARGDFGRDADET